MERVSVDNGFKLAAFIKCDICFHKQTIIEVMWGEVKILEDKLDGKFYK